ncbi:hypothetical protein PABG_07435 [Paracoccidioides brasiliensis Pb03]|nr:hypothetical protein PABG_07435 [Paracoccidioides brasiliensis Pb03]
MTLLPTQHQQIVTEARAIEARAVPRTNLMMEQNDTVAKNLSSTFNIVTAAINAGAAAAEAARDGARVDRTDAASAFLSVLAAASASASGFALVNAPTPAPAPAPVPASTSAFAPASAPAPATNSALTPCTCTFCVCPLLATGRTIASSSASAGFVSAVCDVVPAYEINRKATTVVEVWREYPDIVYPVSSSVSPSSACLVKLFNNGGAKYPAPPLTEQLANGVGFERKQCCSAATSDYLCCELAARSSCLQLSESGHPCHSRAGCTDRTWEYDRNPGAEPAGHRTSAASSSSPEEWWAVWGACGNCNWRDHYGARCSVRNGNDAQEDDSSLDKDEAHRGGPPPPHPPSRKRPPLPPPFPRSSGAEELYDPSYRD